MGSQQIKRADTSRPQVVTPRGRPQAREVVVPQKRPGFLAWFTSLFSSDKAKPADQVVGDAIRSGARGRPVRSDAERIRLIEKHFGDGEGGGHTEKLDAVKPSKQSAGFDVHGWKEESLRTSALPAEVLAEVRAAVAVAPAPAQASAIDMANIRQAVVQSVRERDLRVKMPQYSEGGNKVTIDLEAGNTSARPGKITLHVPATASEADIIRIAVFVVQTLDPFRAQDGVDVRVNFAPNVGGPLVELKEVDAQGGTRTVAGAGAGGRIGSWVEKGKPSSRVEHVAILTMPWNGTAISAQREFSGAVSGIRNSSPPGSLAKSVFLRPKSLTA